MGIIKHHNHKQTKSLWWVIISNLREKILIKLAHKKIVDLEKYDEHIVSMHAFLDMKHNFH